MTKAPLYSRAPEFGADSSQLQLWRFARYTQFNICNAPQSGHSTTLGNTHWNTILALIAGKLVCAILELLQ